MKFNLINKNLIVYGMMLFIPLVACQKDISHTQIHGEYSKSGEIFQENQNEKTIWQQVVLMDATQANSTSKSQGLVIFKLTSDKMLTYKIIVQKMDAGDMLTNAHIHPGGPGVNGPGVIGLKDGVLNLHEFQTMQLTSDQFNLLLNPNQPLYVNVHTQLYPANSIRGQIR